MHDRPVAAQPFVFANRRLWYVARACGKAGLAHVLYKERFSPGGGGYTYSMSELSQDRQWEERILRG